MGLSYPILIGALAFAAIAATMRQKAEIDQTAGAYPARQIAYSMRLYHRAAIAYKTANPAVTGSLPVVPPSFLTDWRFASCADAKSLVTFSVGMNNAQNRDLNAELLRQSVMPPELGEIGGVPSGSAPGIGLSDGRMVNNGYAAVSPACSLAVGVAAIQTQLIP